MPKLLVGWAKTTVAAEAKLAAALASAVSNEIMQTAVAISQGFGDIHLTDPAATILEYPMSLIILYSVLDHMKPGTAEIRKNLTNYIRSPQSHDDVGLVINEIVRWKRAQQQAKSMGIGQLSHAEYLESLMGII